MSNEPSSKRLLAQPPATPAAGPGSDTEKILAAFQRMEAASRGDPATLDRLQTELAELTEVVAAVRAAVLADSDPSALLDDIEARASRMMALAEPSSAAEAVAAPLPDTGERPADEQAFLAAMSEETAPAPQAESEHVPTVSEVVSHLGRAGEPGMSHQPDPAASGGAATTVAMLEAMVEELTAAMPAPAPESQAPPDEPAPPPEVTPPEAEPATATEEAAIEEAAIEAAATEAPARHEAMMPDLELLTNFARMETMPFLPSEVGTAVIFEARTKPEIVDTQAPPIPVEEAQPPALGEPELVMPPVEPPAPQAAPEPEAAPEPSQAIQLPADPPAGEPDLDTLLFEPQPEPDPDPAAALLEPAPRPAQVPPEFAPLEDLTDSSEQPSAGADPLAALKAMSDEERIALFE